MSHHHSSSQQQQQSAHSRPNTAIARNNNNSNNNDKSTPYNPNHPPLYNKHLQPSAPPPSIGEKQLKLFQRVLNRRLSQLHNFTLETHKSLYDQLTIGKTNKASASSSTNINNNERQQQQQQQEVPITNKEIQELFQKLSKKKPESDKDHYISLVEYLLIENFHSSSDNRLDTSLRSHCLQKVKFILLSIDDCFKEELDKSKQKEKSVEAGTTAKASEATATTTSAVATTTTSAVATTMGARSSKPISNNNEKEVIVLDDDDEEEEEAERQQQQRKQVEQSKNATAGTSSSKNSSKNAQSYTQSCQPLNSSIKKAASSNSIELTSTAKAMEASSSLSLSTNNPILHFVPSTKIPPSQEYIPPIDSSSNSKKSYLNTGYSGQSNNVSFTFLPDPKNGHFTYSNSLKEYERSRCEITINTSFESCQRTIDSIISTPIPPPNASSIPHSSIFLDGPALCNFESRLRKWDPYWKLISNCSTFRCQTQQGSGDTIVGYKSTNIVAQRMESSLCKNDGNGLPRTSSVIPIQLKNLFNQKHLHDMIWKEIQWGVSKAGNSTSCHNIRYADREKRLIVRALPLVPNPKYKKIRSDTHQW